MNQTETQIHSIQTGNGRGPIVIWAHGWGQNHQSFQGLLASLQSDAHHIVIDFPGFGASPEPKEVWGTADYADALADFIRTKNFGPVIWVGHSFGCRVGLQIATRHSDLIRGLFLIAGAGLKSKRPPHKSLSIKARIFTFKALKALVPLLKPFGIDEEWLRNKFGSSDYKNASGIIRQIFIKTVNEDLSPVAQNVNCPTQLVYGENDTETPAEMGKRLNEYIAGSDLVILPGQDHYSVLGEGRHQVTPILKQFIKSLEE